MIYNISMFDTISSARKLILLDERSQLFRDTIRCPFESVLIHEQSLRIVHYN